jgi:hypothetical protein
MPRGAFFNKGWKTNIGGLTDPEVVLILGALTSAEREKSFALFNASKVWIAAKSISTSIIEFATRESGLKPPSIDKFKVQSKSGGTAKSTDAPVGKSFSAKPPVNPPVKKSTAAPGAQMPVAQTKAKDQTKDNSKPSAPSKVGQSAKPAQAKSAPIAKSNQGQKINPPTKFGQQQGISAKEKVSSTLGRSAPRSALHENEFEATVIIEVPVRTRDKLQLSAEEVRKIFELLSHDLDVKLESPKRKIKIGNHKLMVTLEREMDTVVGQTEQQLFRLKLAKI